MIEPLIAIDLGSRPAAGLVTGTEQCPVLLRVRRFSRWDSRDVVGVLQEWRREWPRATLVFEETFTERRREKRFLLDVGRKQEAQAGFLAGWAVGKANVLRVPPVNDREAFAAWVVFGRPEEGKGAKGEHVRDMLAVALKALIRRGERAKLVAAGKAE